MPLPFGNTLPQTALLAKLGELGDGEEEAGADDVSVSDALALLTAFHPHTLPPVGLGSGAAALVNKAEAFLHQVVLECRSTPEFMEPFLSTVAGLTTDLGTESLLANVPVALASLLPNIAAPGT